MKEKSKEVRLCDDIDFASDDYALRENRLLRIKPGPSFYRDMTRGKVSFSDFIITIETEHPLIVKTLSRTISVSRRRAYNVDFTEIHCLANVIKPSEPNASMSYLVDYLSLHDILHRQNYNVRLEKRKGRPFLAVYKGSTQIAIHPLNLVELAWLAKL